MREIGRDDGDAAGRRPGCHRWARGVRVQVRQELIGDVEKRAAGQLTAATRTPPDSMAGTRSDQQDAATITPAANPSSRPSDGRAPIEKEHWQRADGGEQAGPKRGDERLHDRASCVNGFEHQPS
jgi:hypothetical protein